jgi:Tfp pilus assembly protein PilN
MHQQINLYQPVFRKQEKVFSATTLLQIGAAVLLLLLIILGHARWTLSGMNNTAQALQQQVNSQTQQLAALEESYRTPDTDALDSEIEQLRAETDQRNTLLSQFDQLTLRHNNGFATQLQALAEVHLPGLWLEGVTVSEALGIELRGITLDARLVPLYLQQLTGRKDLSPTAFEAVSMTRIENGQPQIQFVLRNFKGQTAWN